MSDDNVTKLKAAAILAEMLAQKVERGQNWPGDISEGVSQIMMILATVKEQQ